MSYRVKELGKWSRWRRGSWADALAAARPGATVEVRAGYLMTEELEANFELTG